jgi:hypothetical protein
VVFKWKAPKAVSEPGQSEGDCRARLVQLAREKRDVKLEKLRKSYAPKLARIEERIRKAEQRITQQEAQYGQKKTQTPI